MKTNTSGFYKELWQLALPVSLQSLLVSTLAVADVMMVGSLGALAVAAVGFASKLHFVTMVLIFGFCSASNVLISQYVGAEQFHKVKTTLALTLLTGAGLLIPATLAFAIHPQRWLSFISPDADVVALTAQYILITAPVVLIMTVVTSYETALRAMGQTAMPLALAALSITSNIILNYVLIFGEWGAPQLGVAGAAWATLFSRILQIVALFIYLSLTRHELRLGFRDLAPLRALKPWLSFWWFSLPIAFNFVLWGVGSSLYHVIASLMGTESLAVMSVLTPIENTIISTFIGFSNAASILLGRALGGDHFEYAWQLKKFFVRNAMIFAALTGACVWLAKPFILAPFGRLEPETARVLDQTLLFLCFLMWIKVHNLMSMVSVLRAGGDTIFCLKIDITCMWVIGLPVTAFAGLVLDIPFRYVYLLMFSEEVAKMLISHWRMYQKKWIRNLTEIVATHVPETA